MLTTNLATAYAGYKNNMDALEYYRKYILPDLVRTVRGVEERRRFDQALSLADLVTAQQNLSTSVTSYLTILGQLWTSTVSVADLLQTDDLFQLAQPCELPPLPDLDSLPPLPCRHPCAPATNLPPVTPEPAGTPAAFPSMLPTRPLTPPPPPSPSAGAARAAPSAGPATIIQAQALVAAPKPSTPAATAATEPAPAVIEFGVLDTGLRAPTGASGATTSEPPPPAAFLEPPPVIHPLPPLPGS